MRGSPMAQASAFDSGRRLDVRPRGCELFVGGLSRTVTESTIEKIFSPYGEILELRMMKDMNGVPKGFCFVRFASKEDAYKAIKDKNGYMLNGKKIGVALSSDQDTLFLGSLCKAWSFNEFDRLVHQAFKDVLSVELAFPSKNDESISGRKHLNRGFAFVQFTSHAAAARAHRLASEPDFVIGDIHPAVEWAEKEPEIDPEELAKIKVAFVGNLPTNADENYLKSLFEPFGELDKVAISRKGQFPVGFVHFARRSDLDNAIRRLDGKTVPGPDQISSFHIQVTIAKPMDRGRKRSREEFASDKGRSNIGSHTISGIHQNLPVDYRSKTSKHNDIPLDAVDAYEEAVISLPMAVKDRLLRILRLGIATRYDIDMSCISGLKELPIAAAIAVIDQFMLSGRDKHNKGGYFMSLIAMHQGSQSGPIRSRLDSKRPFEVSMDKSEIISLYGRKSPGSFSTRNDRHLSPPTLGPTHYASSPHENLAPRTILRVSRKRSPVYEAVPSTAVVSRTHSRLDSVTSLPADHPSEPPRYRFDPFTGQPYKFDPFTGEPLAPDVPSRRTGGYF